MDNETVVTATTQNAPGNGNPNATAEQTSTLSKSDDTEAKAFSRGYTKSRQELLSKLGVESVEQLKVKFDAIAMQEQEASTRQLAEQTEKMELAKRLQDREAELVGLRAVKGQLETLRSTLLSDRVKTIGAKHGVRSDALDLLVVAAKDRVKWNDDFTDTVILDATGKPADEATLITEMQQARPYLFNPTGKNGSGLIPRVNGDPTIETKEDPNRVPSLKEYLRK